MSEGSDHRCIFNVLNGGSAVAVGESQPSAESESSSVSVREIMCLDSPLTSIRVLRAELNSFAFQGQRLQKRGRRLGNVIKLLRFETR